MELFWGSMHIELLNRRRWSAVAELSAATAEWIEDFYNPIRRHSPLGYQPPTNMRPYPPRNPGRILMNAVE
jgi:transposase InsO family protein